MWRAVALLVLHSLTAAALPPRCVDSPANCTATVKCGSKTAPRSKWQTSIVDNSPLEDMLHTCSGPTECVDSGSCAAATHQLFQFVPWGSNFGDELGPMLARHVMGGSCGAASTTSHKMAKKPLVGGLGSTLHHHCMKGNAPTIIWGSGALGLLDESQCEGSEENKQFDVRAVRGYKTLDMLLRSKKLTTAAAANVPLGDPALLLPAMFPRCGQACGAPVDEVCVILHYNDYKDARQREVIWREAVSAGVRGFTRAHVIGPQNNPTYMLERILSCKLVLSSSLHGIVFAEAFGVPARWLELAGSRKSEKSFKYKDYYSGTRGRAVLGDSSDGSGGGRFNASFGPAKSIREGLQLGGAPPIPPTYDATPLYRAFPTEELSGCRNLYQ